MTREIKLSGGNVSLVSDIDFERVNSLRWCSGTLGYATNQKGGASNYLHRFIMGNPEGFVVDHINGDRLDNRRENLRICLPRQNLFNTGPKKNNTTGYKGVFFVKRRNNWSARIGDNRKIKCLGSFSNPHDAAMAYNIASYMMHGEFAYQNEYLG